MATLKIYNGSSWDVAIAKTYNGSAWEDQMKYYNGSAWVELYPTLETSMNTSNSINFRTFTSPCYSAISFNADGNEWGANNAGSLNVNRGVWLDSGTAAECFIEYTVNSGSLNWLGWSGRKVMSTTRTAGVFRASPDGVQQANVTFRIYDAISGGNLLDTVTVIISAEYSSGA